MQLSDGRYSPVHFTLHQALYREVKPAAAWKDVTYFPCSMLLCVSQESERVWGSPYECLLWFWVRCMLGSVVCVSCSKTLFSIFFEKYSKGQNNLFLIYFMAVTINHLTRLCSLIWAVVCKRLLPSPEAPALDWTLFYIWDVMKFVFTTSLTTHISSICGSNGLSTFDA